MSLTNSLDSQHEGRPGAGLSEYVSHLVGCAGEGSSHAGNAFVAQGLLLEQKFLATKDC